MDKPILRRANPVVSCREEGPDGALLFQPDTDDLMVINSTGLLIWRELSQPQTRDEIAARLHQAHPEAPLEQLTTDVEAFFESLAPGGFIDEVTPDDEL